jgi:hypothetical protein
MSVAVANCTEENHGDPCRLYAVNDEVVWNNGTQTASQTASSGGGNDDRGGATAAVARSSFASR